MAEGLLFPRQHRLLQEPVYVRKEDIENDCPPVFHPRRFSDPVSPLNDSLIDQTRMLAAAVKLIDERGLRILSVDADRSRNKRVLVEYSRKECDALEGVEVARQGGFSHWSANRFGVEIRWCIPVEAA